MSLRGWHLNGLSDPPAVHIACTVRLLRFFVKSEYANDFMNLRKQSDSRYPLLTRLLQT